MGRKLLTVFIALALVATACGDDDDAPAASGDPRETEDGAAGEGASPSDATASIAEPKDGATVARRFAIGMTAEGIEIEPAASGVNDGAGHFHVMIDSPCLDEGEVIPKDDRHVHFGGGQLGGQLFLEPGARPRGGAANVTAPRPFEGVGPMSGGATSQEASRFVAPPLMASPVSP
jgi:hypothetical protein